MRFSLLLAAALLVSPMVSSCSKPDPPPTRIELKTLNSADGFSVDMPEPHLVKTVDVGKAYYFNCPQGTYKVIVNTVALANSNTSTPKIREMRDQKAIDTLTKKAGAYVDALNSTGTRSFLLGSKYKAFEDKGTTGAIPGGSDGRHHMKMKYADNDIALAANSYNGEYIIQGFVGDNVVYVVSVEGRPEFVNAPEAKQFLDSFKINGPSTSIN